MIIMAEDLQIVHGYSIEQYKGIFNNISVDATKQDYMLLFFNIIQIDNIVTRYLMLYELLMNVVTIKHTQKEVTAFIKDQFNPVHTTCVGFHPTRRTGKNFDEDDITYYRNLLAHNDSSAIPQDFDKVLWSMYQALIDVLFFKLDQMP